MDLVSQNESVINYSETNLQVWLLQLT